MLVSTRIVYHPELTSAVRPAGTGVCPVGVFVLVLVCFCTLCHGM
jgi:hypothetical protein